MRSLNLDQLRTLVTIDALGSFAAASRQLHLAPPTISLHIQELEQRLDARLLLRERGRVVATAIGLSVIQRARRILGECDQLLDEVRRQVEGRSGKVRVGASTGALATLLPQAIETLRLDAPEIEIHVAVLTSQQSMERLRQGLLELALVALPRLAPAGHPHSGVATRSHHGLHPRTLVATGGRHPRWLASRPLILNDASTHLHRIITEWFAPLGQAPEPRIELNFNDAARSLVAAGYGAALLPLDAGLRPPPDARILLRPLKPSLWRRLGIAHRTEALEPASQRVLEALQRQSAEVRTSGRRRSR
ncbi:MAG: LysR family transcriptional regulator [Burkholderiaceae bacterium]